MDFEEKKPSKLKGFFKVLVLSILLSGILLTILYFTNVITFKQNNNSDNSETTPSNKKEVVDIFKTSDEEIEKIFQNKYNDIYSELEEGKFLQTTITKDILFGGNNVTGYKINLAKLNDNFTDDCVKYIKNKFYYTDDNENYYIVFNQPNYKYFSNSIFGVTNQGKRTLKLILHDNDLVLLKAEVVKCAGSICPPEYGGEYIAFKKVDDKWKIEMFE